MQAGRGALLVFHKLATNLFGYIPIKLIVSMNYNTAASLPRRGQVFDCVSSVQTQIVIIMSAG